MNYHSIEDIPAEDDHYQMTTPKELFREQMRHLSEGGWRVISCGDAIAMSATGEDMPSKVICLTFDDGFRDVMMNAAPILMRYNIPATLFLAVDFIGKAETWLDWDEITELSKTCLFSFGSHSMTHRKLAGLSLEELDEEIGLSKRILEDRLKRRIDLFAYPFGCYGAFDRASIDMIKSRLYRAAFTTIVGFNSQGADPYTVKRMCISWADDGAEFAKELSGAYDWYAIWQKVRGSV